MALVSSIETNDEAGTVSLVYYLDGPELTRYTCAGGSTVTIAALSSETTISLAQRLSASADALAFKDQCTRKHQLSSAPPPPSIS